ncbi:MAG TPA: hypothetical protein VF600_15475 [Abditibacteriaceae bacterium]|jgi:hypothetical protein
MLKSRSPLKIDEIAPHFASLLHEEGTSMEQPALEATWRAFAKLCHEQLSCDDERLLFEADLSTSQPDHFYVHFARTCYGREPKGHVWSHEVICDFLFTLDDALEEFSCTIEAEEFVCGSEEPAQFLSQVENQKALWQELAKRQPVQGEIYIGES